MYCGHCALSFSKRWPETYSGRTISKTKRVIVIERTPSLKLSSRSVSDNRTSEKERFRSERVSPFPPSEFRSIFLDVVLLACVGPSEPLTTRHPLRLLAFGPRTYSAPQNHLTTDCFDRNATGID